MKEILFIQEIVYSTLTNDSELTKIAKTYDEVSKDATFPYIQIGDATGATTELQCSDGIMEVIHTVDIFSSGKGTLEALTIAEKVRELLKEYNNPDYKGYSVWFDKVESCKIEKIVIETGIIRHAEMQLKFTISKN
jgi:hypothetical protein